MDATSAHAVDEEMEISRSLARRRHRPSHANVRSTTQRDGRISKPLAHRLASSRKRLTDKEASKMA